MVMLEYDGGASTSIVYLRASRAADGISLHTRCDHPPFPVHSGATELTNGVISLKILGVLKGSYLAF
ncbi:hypothetical protein [Microvirga alba]|uniref:Uncharacterized protein n=1 Tax=Microvirga alba TaxID=2791025 RepID=A0A931BTZ0_9HYPH|nr:hypothetical protein [Microvirga alba]MBF9234704.1 hypothetical protein [Microvirga alba]